MNWYSKIVEDISNLPSMIAYYENEIENSRGDVIIHGNVEKSLKDLPGITENIFAKLQELEAVLRYMELQLRKLRRTYFQKYLENYNRTLTSRDAEKYTEGENSVVDYECLINEVALIRNKYLGLMKALDQKSYMLGHITRLRTAGMEDVSI